MHCPCDRPLVELLVHRETGRTRKHDRVGDDANVDQASPNQRREELSADRWVGHGRIQHLSDAACQRRVRRVDHRPIGIESNASTNVGVQGRGVSRLEVRTGP